jgi:hypothetical protein
MAFKNINTATDQILGRVAGCQHHAWGIRNPSGQKSVFMTPMKFNEWLVKGMNYQNQIHGTTFETVCPGLMRIIAPGKVPMLRTLEDFKREHKQYEEEYYL